MKNLKKGEIHNLAAEAVAQPKETLQKIEKKSSKLKISIAREINENEKRIALTPSAVEQLTFNGFEVVYEKGAGDKAKFSDEEYAKAGAKITENRKEIFSADIILKVAFPALEEIEDFEKGKILFSALNYSLLTKQQIQTLINKRITGICFETFADSSGNFPLIQSMSEIAGKRSIILASELLAKSEGESKLLGGITGIIPTKVVILGAGIVALHAAKTALSLGAEVQVFDDNLSKLRRLISSLNQNIFNSTIIPKIINNSIQTADIVIGAFSNNGSKIPFKVPEEMVMQMKKNAVIMDISIDQGGCFETSEPTNMQRPYYKKHGVFHYCVPNIPSTVPKTASIGLSNSLSSILLEIIENGGLENFIWEKNNARKGFYLYRGVLTNRKIGDKFNIGFRNLDILLTSNI
jgi:alanine dehydrogenase